jgi:N utilization substance protein B
VSLQDPKLKRQSRELALQILFQTEFTSPVPYQDFLELFEERTPKEVVDYADELIRGVKARVAEIDALIQSASQHWKVERMSMVDRNVLRVAVFEMKFLVDPLKPSIAINEAVDIAKRFGTTESGSFVNGLLDQVRRQNQWE